MLFVGGGVCSEGGGCGLGSAREWSRSGAIKFEFELGLAAREVGRPGVSVLAQFDSARVGSVLLR